MATKLKKILISIFSTVAFLTAGIFFVGCGVDYSKISLTVDTPAIELEVGQTAQLTFSIEGYQKGFSNRVKANPRSDSATAAFSASEPVYINDSQFAITITALAGGHGQLNVSTLEAAKECSVDVSVKQYATSMQLNGQELFVSNHTAFKPTDELFTFNANTTEKELSFYYVPSKDSIDLTGQRVVEVDLQNKQIVLSNGAVVGELQKFTEATLNADNQLCLDKIVKDDTGDFYFLAVYDYSLENYTQPLCDIGRVHILPDLQVKTYGGYQLEDGSVDFEEISLENAQINIVRGNADKNIYILKLEMIDTTQAVDVNFALSQHGQPLKDENNPFDIDEYHGSAFEKQPNIKYFKFALKDSLQQVSADVKLSVHYSVAKDIYDQSVNREMNFSVNTLIAPSKIMVNGKGAEELSAEDEKIELYYTYKHPDYGWKELDIDVVSASGGLSPDFEYIYFEFNDSCFDIKYKDKDEPIVSGQHFTSFDKPFLIRGSGRDELDNVPVVIHLKSNIIQGAEEITTTVYFKISRGVEELCVTDGFNKDELFLDVEKGKQDFNYIIYAKSLFQSVSWQLVGGEDVVEFLPITTNGVQEEICKYNYNDGFYYLNMSVAPKARGTGRYKLTTDNGTEAMFDGTEAVFTFSCTNSLLPESTYISVLSENETTIYDFYKDKSENSAFDDLVYIEIQNDNNDGNITYDKAVRFQVISNATNLQATTYSNYFKLERRAANTYAVVTKELGDGKVDLVLSGFYVDNFARVITELVATVYVSSYANVSEFTLKNGEANALSNVVYFGGGSEEDASVTFTPRVVSEDCNNFYMYQFSADAIAQIYSGKEESENGFYFDNANLLLSQNLLHEKYDRKFIYFYAQNAGGQPLTELTETKIDVVWQHQNQLGQTVTEDPITIALRMTNGLMIYAPKQTFEYINADGQTETFTVTFSNVYQIGGYGEFDMSTFTFRYAIPDRSVQVVLRAELSQKGGVQPTKRFLATIYPTRYISVENISLLSGLNQTQIDFSNEKLIVNIGVTTIPSNSTNKELVVDVVMTNGNTHREMLSYVVDNSRKDSGIYNIKLTCNNTGLETVEGQLTCKLYIFPKEWGTTYTQINPNLKPIVIDVQYRNGSKSNPYVLETAEDVLKIGSNEAMLKSHYVISNVVDMETVRTGTTPIGIIDGKLIGFSGSIVGTTSQASISNLHITNNNFSAVIGGICYSGLFAKINEGAKIENVLLSGDINLSAANNTYASIFACVNEGELVNVGVNVKKSSIASDYALHFGALSAINVGHILQDFTKYESKSVVDDKPESEFAGQTSKNLAYFEDYLTVNLNTTNAFIGGIVGANNGVIERKLSDTYKMYGYTPYSAYALIDVQGNATGAYVGGGVGVSVYNGALGMPFATLTENKLDNLLVGGQISSIGLNGADYIGGIVGYVKEFHPDEQTAQMLTSITNNTTRVFVQGKTYVGGIVGYDDYINAGQNASRVTITGNAIEAVDHLLNSFEAANVIRLYNTALAAALNAEDVSQQQLQALYSVGNAYNNNRQYVDAADNSLFSADSYVKRNYVYTQDMIVSLQNGNYADYYGDFLLVEKDKSAADSFVIKASKQYTKKDVELKLEKTPYQMTSADGTEAVYFMHYLQVSGDLAGQMGDRAQEEIAQLNQHNPNDQFYPFSLASQYVALNAGSSNLISVDANGMISVKGTGRAELTLSSILNEAVSRKIYLYIVNYFNTNITSSIFYTTPSLVSDRFENNQTVFVYGDSHTNAYVVPNYTHNDADFSISDNGVLYYQNVAYSLVKNTQVGIAAGEQTEIEDLKQFIETVENFALSGTLTGDFIAAQIYQQNIAFYKTDKAYGGAEDAFTLVPVLKVEVEGKIYLYPLLNAKINLTLQYQETATAIRTMHTRHSIQTNGEFSDVVSVESTNENEKLYYRIVKDDGSFVQERMVAKDYEDDAAYHNYINTISDAKDLFDLHLQRQADSTDFDLTCSVNTKSDRFVSRYEKGKSIFGHYTITFYANRLDEEGAVKHSIDLLLSESTLNYISIINHSDFNQFAVADKIVVPSQRGLLEISLDPLDSIFEQFYIADNKINVDAGAGRTIFKLAYENVTANGTQFVSLDNFGGYDDQNRFTFTYQQLLLQYSAKNIVYNGKIYISYLMEAVGLKDNANVAFDVCATYGNKGQYKVENTIPLRTKLTNYARLEFLNKQAIGGHYYLARGLSYDLVLNAYGYDENSVSFEISSPYVTLTKVGAKYVLKVDPNFQASADDTESGAGTHVTITPKAKKTVNNITVETPQEKLSIYLMEYVLNYGYIEGQYQDIVRGMENGVINIAVGNPFKLETNLRAFMEYDTSNPEIAAKVEALLADFSANMTWTVFENAAATDLQQGKAIASQGGFYSISSFTFTPLKLYNHTQNIYHFSMGGYYTMSGGEYKSTTISQGANRLYTEFSFDVHEQSTQDSPIPIETYEDLMNMDEGEWYILLNSFDLPDSVMAAATGKEEFKPITTAIAGLDGNGKTLKFSGNYNFDGLEQVGLFASVGENTILQNVKLEFETTKFNMNVETFNVGLIAAENNGVITNCSAYTVEGATLSVDCLSSTISSYVAGIVGQNTGFITNSQSGVNIITTVNLAGVVGVNGGHIASTYYRGGALKNTTNANASTAGFVVRNSGQIYASYVSGDDEDNSESAYYKGEKHSITANADIAGFAFENSGQIYDCYSNLYLQVTGYNAAGFAFTNTGRIERSFSTSVLESGKSSNRGFAYENDVSAADDNDNGIFECFYLKQPEFEDDDGNKQEAVNMDTGDIVLTDENKDLTNITPINLAQFKYTEDSGEIKENSVFKNFVIEIGRNINSVWFYNDKDNNDNFNHNHFNRGRIELVAANIIAAPEREFVSAESVFDPETGATYVRYNYRYASTSPALGDEYNPILISSAQEFENYIVRENNASNINKAYYRLISDIDYTEYPHHSSTFATRFLGYFEGNFMDINNINLLSSNKLEFGGLFAEVGSSAYQDSVGTVMNFTMKVAQVDFANAKAVGAVAGKLDGGKILNVSLVDGQDISVVGNNIVGGAVGLAVGEYKLQNVYSTLSAKTRNKTIYNGNEFNEENSSLDNYSFAGSIVGVLSGTGKIINAKTDTVVSAIAHKAGLMFGFVDSGATVQGAVLDNNLENILTASGYAGLIAGQSAGYLKAITVNGVGEFKNFSLSPEVPTAVGGVVGLVSGGTLENVEMTQNINLSTISSDEGVDYIGGIVGRVNANVVMSNITVEADIVGFKFVGAVAGMVENSGISTFKDINAQKCELTVCGVGQTIAAAGGLAGGTGENTEIALSVSDSQKRNNFDIDVHMQVYSYDKNGGLSLHVGAIIGQNGGGSHMISHTDSTLTGGAMLLQLNEGFIEKNLSVSVGQNNQITYGTEDATNATKAFDVSAVNAEGCTFSCGTFTYKVPISLSDNFRRAPLYINLYGTAKVTETTVAN